MYDEQADGGGVRSLRYIDQQKYIRVEELLRMEGEESLLGDIPLAQDGIQVAKNARKRRKDLVQKNGRFEPCWSVEW